MRVTIQAKHSQSTASLTKYVSERGRDAEREGKEPRSLFSAKEDKLAVTAANQVLNGTEKETRADVYHLIISLRPEEFYRMGGSDKERSKAFHEVVRGGMEEARDSIHAQELKWVAGIHLNTDNPHAHVAIWREFKELTQQRWTTLNMIPYRWLPKSKWNDGEKEVTLSPLLQRLTDELDKQQAAYRERNPTYEKSIGLAIHAKTTNDPITEIATPILEIDDPIRRTETFDKEAEGTAAWHNVQKAQHKIMAARQATSSQPNWRTTWDSVKGIDDAKIGKHQIRLKKV